ncbi:BREX-1 system adenine-specific DNA-methyltransferase PglX [Ruegeria arenilitoris]|uniref:BREX-1 system adenine-specific DNA-methyltransferase PglX n=1 Tax=Ruegeria arenilitoris TaxID=1173585 RepID=UPI001479F618|nr:BREX-1 system adenine-specific DNA-methyltransferase PglX [Ruegeria arenilitoris]
MDTNALKKFAQAARNLLIDQVTSKLDLVLDPASAARREHPQAIKDLEAAITRDGRQQVIEQVAYTWFNRFTALRFMDSNGLNTVRVVSPAEGATRPEILAEATAGNLPDGAPATIQSLLDGRTPSNDPQGEAYRLLLVHACNGWHKHMPFLFEEIDDYTELLMPEDLLSQTSILAELRKVMTEDACQDVEIIGWLYQFYISEKKDQVFAGLKKNQKITAENIPAATQLFTPHWIVRYLVENSLGRLWLLNRPGSKLAERMDYYIAPEEPETDFLKIGKPEEIKICDPACGSGHMLTYAFDLLYAIYEEEGYDPTEIPALILTHNLTGVEIDDRAGALAAFALAMKAAARLGRRRFLRMEAKPDICVLQNVTFTDAEMQDVAAVVGKDLFTDELRETLGQFEQAKNFGSLIVPKLRDPAETLRVVEARDFGGDLLLKEVQERVVSVLRMAEALSPKYHVVVANPPYAGSSGLNSSMQAFAKKTYPDSKADLFAMFMERSLGLARESGFMGMINMQAWMFLSSYEKLRTKLLDNYALRSMAHLGTRGFDTIGGEVVSTTAFVFTKFRDPDSKGTFLRLVSGRSEQEKSNVAKESIASKNPEVLYRASSNDFLNVPGTPVVYWLGASWIDTFRRSIPLGDVSTASEGVKTGNNERFLRYWFEVNSSDTGPFADRNPKWVYHLKGGEYRKWHGNYEYVILWAHNGAEIKAQSNSGIQGQTAFNRDAAIWSDITSGGYSARLKPSGYLFDSSSPAGFLTESERQNDLLGLLNSKISGAAAPMLNPTLHFKVGNFRSLPYFPVEAGKVEQLIAFSKSDWDAYETSWDFTTLPLLAPDHRGETLEDSYAHLRTHWQSMTDEMQRLEEENNRIFIDAYGLQDELTPEVPIEEITLTCNSAYRYGVKGTEEDREVRLRADTMAEFLSYAVGCMFGRYGLDAPGLILANQGETLADYLARVPEPSFMPDEDNVIPVLDGDWFPDDITERFRLFLRTTFGEAHFRENLKFIEDSLGKDIRKYFTKDFYADHVKRYKKRPIYWMFSSPRGTFNALIYMHRYRPDTVSVVLNDYLRAFISKLEAERERLDKLADDPTATQGQRTKALRDAATVARQIDELNEWERDVIFPLAQQKIEIDLDDGVKHNYPLFGSALKKITGLS